MGYENVINDDFMSMWNLAFLNKDFKVLRFYIWNIWAMKLKKHSICENITWSCDIFFQSQLGQIAKDEII